LFKDIGEKKLDPFISTKASNQKIWQRHPSEPKFVEKEKQNLREMQVQVSIENSQNKGRGK